MHAFLKTLSLLCTTALLSLATIMLFSAVHSDEHLKAYAHASAHALPQDNGLKNTFLRELPTPIPTELPLTGAALDLIPNRGGVPILMYHYIGNHYDPSINTPNNTLMHGLSVRTDDFDAQMSFLASKQYSTVTFTRLREIQAAGAFPAKNYIVLTFDDGYVDFYTNAFPILKKYNLKGTVYIITKLVGQPGYLSWEMIKEMQQSGFISFGSHTRYHNYLPGISSELLNEEVRLSKVDLEEHLGQRIVDFCYPSGRYNPAVVSAVQAAGYTQAVTTAYGVWTPMMNQLLIPRYRISGELTIDGFKSMF